MAIKKRMVKGRAYYYLEKNLRTGENEWKTFSSYLGPRKPGKTGLRRHEKKLETDIRNFIREKILLPETRFIDEKTALMLERIRSSHKKALDALGKAGREGYLVRQRETFITNTNAIEGSRLTLDQTRKILDLKKKYEAEGREELEVINMEQCLVLYDALLDKKEGLGEKAILQLHLLLLKAIPGYEAYAGVWRPVNVFIRGSGYAFPDWKEVPALMRALLEWYREKRGKIHPVELAAEFHVRFVTIHPFADGNGRMARLLLNYILQANGFPFTDIPFSKRDGYFETQEKGHFGDYKPFALFLAGEIKEQFRELRRKSRKRRPPA